MSIFSRRVVQRLINENRSFLSEAQVKEQVKKLNSGDCCSIATEWEVVILNALSKIGSVVYEKDFDGPSKPDVYFDSGDTTPFVADVTTLSDKSYEKDNPVDYLYECIRKYFNKRGLFTKGLTVEVGSDRIGEYSDQKVKLSLPDKKDLPRFVKNKFSIIADSITKKPNQAFKSKIAEEGVAISITYNPHNEFFSGGYLSYTVPYSLKRNSIHNSLKSKADQLRKSKYKGVKGVFLCDGGCDALNNDFHGPTGYTKGDIIKKVFKSNKTISFVAVFTLEEEGYKPFQITKKKYIKGTFYFNSIARYPVEPKLYHKLKTICNYFPVPESMPVNAINQMKFEKNKGLSHLGGFSMGGDEIKISSRMVAELLAGVLDYKKFDERCKSLSHDGRNRIKEFFLRKLTQGKMIENISIEKCPDEDDDWVRFKFGKADVAISKFY